MSARFFVEEPVRSEVVVLRGPEAHHLLHVLRAKPGERVVLFDGTGQEFTARIEACGRRDVRLMVEAAARVSREATRHVTLGAALPKGERQRWLVEKAVELGVASLVPLVADRGVSQPSASALERLGRAVVEASKQCGRTRLMQVLKPVSTREYFAASCGPASQGALWMCAHPGSQGRMPFDVGKCDRVILAVGPEGGFTDEEVHLARDSGWLMVDLGPRILRVETAALALAAYFGLGAAKE